MVKISLRINPAGSATRLPRIVKRAGGLRLFNLVSNRSPQSGRTANEGVSQSCGSIFLSRDNPFSGGKESKMNRLLTLASSSILATGLVILPVSVFAQPTAGMSATTPVKPTVVTPPNSASPAVTREMKTPAGPSAANAAGAPAAPAAATNAAGAGAAHSADAAVTPAAGSAVAKTSKTVAPGDIAAASKPEHEKDHHAAARSLQRDETKASAAHSGAAPIGTTEKSKTRGAS
jgi:hypothetical protein